MMSAGSLLALMGFLVCTFAQEDLGEKVFLFPKETSTAHVLLKADLKKPLQQVSVCMRSYTDLKRHHAFFSAAVPGRDNAFLMYVISSTQWNIWVTQEQHHINTDPDTLNWKHSCMTWDSTTGVVQLWVNGKPYPRKTVKKGTTISTDAIIVLGQEQDSYGGGFDPNQSFVGEMSDVHMWDYVLTPGDIQKNMYGDYQGNVLNWNSLHYEIKGDVLVEPKLSLYGTN